MKIMITLPVADMTKSDFLRLGNIVHRPDLAGRSEEHLLEELAAHGADGLITARRPAPETLAAWRRSGPGRRFLAYTIGIPPRDAPDDLAELQLTGETWRPSGTPCAGSSGRAPSAGCPTHRTEAARSTRRDRGTWC